MKPMLVAIGLACLILVHGFRQAKRRLQELPPTGEAANGTGGNNLQMWESLIQVGNEAERGEKEDDVAVETPEHKKGGERIIAAMSSEQPIGGGAAQTFQANGTGGLTKKAPSSLAEQSAMDATDEESVLSYGLTRSEIQSLRQIYNKKEAAKVELQKSAAEVHNTAKVVRSMVEYAHTGMLAQASQLEELKKAVQREQHVNNEKLATVIATADGVGKDEQAGGVSGGSQGADVKLDEEIGEAKDKLQGEDHAGTLDEHPGTNTKEVDDNGGSTVTDTGPEGRNDDGSNGGGR